MNSIFITGTDTGVGKTYVTVQLIKQLNKLGFKTLGIKPIASGCELNEKNEWANADALALQEASSIKQPYSIVNPIALKEAIAPHLAAEKENKQLSVLDTLNRILSSIQSHADIHFIEGVGGWAVPLNHNELLSDMVKQLNIPVILVVGIRLGCLNHAILTSRNIQEMNIPFIGWIANCIDPDMLEIDANINTLKKFIPVPC